VNALPETLVRFSGGVECRRDASGPLGLTLVGAVAAGEVAHLAFLGAPPQGLPAQLETAVVERLGPREFRISAAAGSWTLLAAHTYLHLDVGRRFYDAIPPRPVPLGKRIFWRLVLAVAASPLGHWWLRRPTRGVDR